MKFGSLIDHKLLTSKSCDPLITPLLLKHKRKQFGLLESPSLLNNLYDGVVSYKIFLCGKTASGKSTLILKLLGKDLAEAPSETLGIETSVVYWPVRIVETGKMIMFKITFWDSGESNLNSYNYLLPSCLEDVDCVLYVFSLKSKGSWDALPSLITKIDVGDDVLEACVGTQLNFDASTEVTPSMTKDFEEAWKFPVLTIRDIGVRRKKFSHSYECFADVAPFMNRLCELLWYKDEVKAGLVQKAAVDYCFVDELDEETSSTVITFC